MLHHTKAIIGRKLSATDGEIGHVDDFYFDGQSWAVRHVVVATGPWLRELMLLLSPRDIGRSDEAGRHLPFNLTRAEIEHSPSISHHRPVSGQLVAKYYHDSGWPARLQGQRLWGTTDPPFAVPAPPPDLAGLGATAQSDDANLHSARTLIGFRIEATDGVLGTVSGFLLDDQDWTVQNMVVEAGHWYAGREILIPPGKVERVGYTESTVYVKMTKDELRHTVELAVAPAVP